MELTSEKSLARQTDETQKIRKRFTELLDKTNKEDPKPADVKARSHAAHGRAVKQIFVYPLSRMCKGG